MTIGIQLIMARSFLRFVDGRPIDASMVESYRDHKAPTVDSNTWRSYVFGLNYFLSFLGAEARFEPPKLVRKEAEPLRKEEFLRLLQAADAQDDRVLAKRDRAMLLLLGEGAARAGELIKLQVKDLDLEAGTAIVRRPKGRHDRRIFFGEASRVALSDYLTSRTRAAGEDGACVFISARGRRLQGRNTVYLVVQKLAREANLERRVHPHMFRHMRISELSKQGLGPFMLQRFAGHRDIGTTMAYVHIDDDDVREAVKARPMVECPEEASLEGQMEDIMLALARRLAAGEISEATYRTAVDAVERSSLGGIPLNRLTVNPR
jgi:site-specific recombinase XerD